MNTSAPTHQDLFEVLLEKKRFPGEDVVDYPVSMLQRRFRLSYSRTVALLNELEKGGLIRHMSETAIHILITKKQNSSRETNNT